MRQALRQAYKVWYAVWVNDESCVFVMRRTKKAAKSAMRDAHSFMPGVKLGMKRLTEKIKPKRQRRRKSRKHQVSQTVKGHMNATLIL